MKYFLLLLMIFILIIPVYAQEPELPRPPAQAEGLMPEQTEDLHSALQQLLQNVFRHLRPDLVARRGLRAPHEGAEQEDGR